MFIQRFFGMARTSWRNATIICNMYGTQQHNIVANAGGSITLTITASASTTDGCGVVVPLSGNQQVLIHPDHGVAVLSHEPHGNPRDIGSYASRAWLQRIANPEQGHFFGTAQSYGSAHSSLSAQFHAVRPHRELSPEEKRLVRLVKTYLGAQEAANQNALMRIATTGVHARH
jgi:hypothetical protein